MYVLYDFGTALGGRACFFHTIDQENMDLEIYLKTNLGIKVHLQDMLAAAVSPRSSDSSSTVGCFEKLNSLARPPANRTWTLFLYFYKSSHHKERLLDDGKKKKKIKVLTTSSLCSMRGKKKNY